ncbi:hypothetical protein SAMN04487831_103276 [Pseudobutyrivibrio sp. UC1225]|uniref:hypothetical protein n=1 Tax=Pseudobutyrivibrio sp. UC1225 TaxID=1798185 RepID=UPI0008ECD634|nr:hypothetical protein [Pseudobutyrivibrio sp. UC1225]SFN78313.1 hypothetical protein SAMN04487831_103276 [Pseudobutyrivibrio sp. UC1225]
MDQNLLQDTSKKRLSFFAGMMFLGAILILVYSALTGNDNQKFTDIVVEFTAMDGSNKSAERTMFYLFSFFGAFIYGLYFLIGKYGKHKEDAVTWNRGSFVTVGLAVSLITNLVLYKTISWIVLGALIITAVARIKNRDLVVSGAAFVFIAVYAICGIYRAFVFFGGTIPAGEKKIALLAFIISMVVFLFGKSEKVYMRGILIGQLLIPFTLLIYITSNYMYGTELYKINIPKRALILVLAIIAAFVAEAVLKIKKEWNSPDGLGSVLTLGACTSIMSFNRFSGTGSIVPTDLHHPFENIIGYSQIFELGQKPFSEYIPVSGMYPLLQGWVFKVFGHGLASFYYLTQNLFYLLILTAIVYLLRKQLKAEWVLLISIVFTMTDYNRVALIAPITLLLAWPSLIQKKNLWLKAWFLTSFVHGLYYPVFGAAVCFGFLPLGIWQIYTYAKSGQLLRDVKTVKFWAWWIVCFVPVICGLGWLHGTVKHMLAMGAQTIYADGMARFGQMAPENFLSYISNMPAKVILYYILSYLIVIAIVWLSVALFLKSGNVYIENKRIRINNPENGFLALSMGLMMLVSFSYTVVRFDYNEIYARSYGVVTAAFVILIVLIGRFIKDENRNTLWIFAFAIFIISVVSAEGVLHIGDGSKMEASYTVPEGYVYVANDKPRLGECFIEQSEYEYVTRTNNYVDTLGRDNSYFGLVDSFGLFYLCDIKGDSVMEILNTIKGYGAVEESIENIKANDSIVGLNVNPLRNYYLYHWLLTSGEYVFDNNARLFLPNDGSVSREQILAQNNNVTLPLDYVAEDIGKVAGSFGSSMDTLESIFTEPDISYNLSTKGDEVEVSFDKVFDGNDADFIYLEFENRAQDYSYVLYDNHSVVEQSAAGIIKGLLRKEYNPDTKVTVSWISDMGEKCSQTCNMDEGKLLFPVGAVRGWLMNSHSKLTITVTKGGNEIKVPVIKTLRMLKCREVE